MKGGLSGGRWPKVLRNVWRRLGNETVSVGLKWRVKCRGTKSECQCRATLVLGWMLVSDGKNGTVSSVGNTPFMGPIIAQCRSMLINTDQNSGIDLKYLSMSIIADKIPLNDQHWKEFERYWSALIGIGQWSRESCKIYIAVFMVLERSSKHSSNTLYVPSGEEFWREIGWRWCSISNLDATKVPSCPFQSNNSLRFS